MRGFESSVREKLVFLTSHSFESFHASYILSARPCLRIDIASTAQCAMYYLHRVTDHGGVGRLMNAENGEPPLAMAMSSQGHFTELG